MPHPVGTLFPIYERYMHEKLIPHYRKRPDHYGPPSTQYGYEVACRAVAHLMNNPDALDGISSEAMGGITWMANRSITLIQRHGNLFAPIEGETEEELLRGLLQSVWPTGMKLHMPPPDAVH